MTIRSFLRNDGQFAQVDAGSISISTTTTTAFMTYLVSTAMAADKDIAAAGNTSGPFVAQGTSGIWLVSGSAVFTCGAGNSNFVAELSDGTTITAVSEAATINSASFLAIPVVGIYNNPAGNIRIMAFTGGSSGFLKTQSYITAVRIG